MPAASSWPTPSAGPPFGLVGWDAAALAAFQTPTLTPPMGPEWIADTGATYHTTPDPGILTSVRPPSSSLPSSIMVENGSCLPVTFMGAAGLPGFSIFLMFLSLLLWSTIFFLFAVLLLIILVLSSLTLLVLL
jgi:hypothetical protein